MSAMTKHLMESHMRDAVANNPEKYLGERGVTILQREYPIGSYRFDILAQDRHGGKLVIELQKGTLDRQHAFKVLDYCDEFRDRHPNDCVEVMVIANRIPRERQKRFLQRGVAFKEIPESEFLSDDFVKQKLAESAKTEAVASPTSPVENTQEGVTRDARPKRRIIVREQSASDQHSSISFNPYKDKMYVLNTDAKSLGSVSPHDKWFEHKSAFTGSYFDDPTGYTKYGERVLGKFSPFDILIMYANKIGGVGVGKVEEHWDGAKRRNNQIVYAHPYEAEEYQIAVDWFADLRSRPIRPADIIEANNGRLLNSALVGITRPAEVIEMLKKYGVPINLSS